MVYCNADGSRVGMCGNAALCSTRLAVRLGIVPGPEVLLQTDSGLVRARCVGPGWAAELLLPDFQLPAPVPLSLQSGEQWMDVCSVGVPHLVIFSEGLGDVDIVTRGKALRNDPTFQPAGLNVNFIGKSVTGSDPVWQLRTYERGVEAETLACGTGTTAAAFALAQRGLDQLPIRIRSWGGNVFSVAGRIEPGVNGSPGWAREPWLCGEGRLVFEGRYPVS
jgi:diaminopimelate epimerase